MPLELLLAIAAIVVSVLIYFAGVQRGTKQERDRQAHGEKLERDRQAHEEKLERERNEQSLASKVADEYVSMANRHYDSGLHALARLGLQRLGTDKLIRHAIHEMEVRTGTDPWAGKSALLQGLDLVAFFELASERKVNFFETSIEQHIAAVRAVLPNQSAA